MFFSKELEYFSHFDKRITEIIVLCGILFNENMFDDESLRGALKHFKKLHHLCNDNSYAFVCT